VQRVMVPVPPRKVNQPVGDLLAEPPLDRPRRVAADNRVGGNVLGDDRTCCDDSGPDLAARQDDGAMPDPDVVADMNAAALAPGKEFGLVALAWKIGTGAIGKVCLRRSINWMVARIVLG
jgi:hypothetical protein